MATLQWKSVFLSIDHSKSYVCVDIYTLDMYIYDHKFSDTVEKKKILEFVSASFNGNFLKLIFLFKILWFKVKLQFLIDKILKSLSCIVLKAIRGWRVGNDKNITWIS